MGTGLTVVRIASRYDIGISVVGSPIHRFGKYLRGCLKNGLLSFRTELGGVGNISNMPLFSQKISRLRLTMTIFRQALRDKVESLQKNMGSEEPLNPELKMMHEWKSRRIMMKALAINGSHRKGKNTATMLRLVLEELEKEGVRTELLEISDLNIEFCRACNRCLKKSECSIQHDDVPRVAEKMTASDAIIIGSPVYFGNVTGMLKAFMDRTRWMHMTENLLDGKLGAALTHAGLRNGGQEMTQSILERFLQHHGLRVVEARDPRSGVYNLGPMGTLYDSMVGDEIHWKRGVMQDSLTVKTCRVLGQNLLRLLKQS